MKNTKETGYFQGLLNFSLYFGYTLGKVTKLHFLESPQKSLKTRQHPFQ